MVNLNAPTLHFTPCENSVTLGEYLHKKFKDAHADVNEICTVFLTTTLGNTYSLEWSTAVFTTGGEINIVMMRKPEDPKITQLFGVDAITFSPLENSWRVYVFDITNVGFDALVHKDTRHVMLRPSRKKQKGYQGNLAESCFKIELP